MISQLPNALAQSSSLELPASLKRNLLKQIDIRPSEKPLPTSTWQFPSWLSWRTASGLAILMVVAFLLWWISELNTALAQERTLRAEFANLVSQQELVLEVIDSNKTIKQALRSPTGAPAYGKIYTRPDMADVVVMVAKLPDKPTGQAFHLWLTSQNKTELAGVLNTNEQGFGLIVFKANRNGPTFDSVRVTLQPMGSTSPSDPPVLIWDVQR
jgi:hypothetical protein